MDQQTDGIKALDQLRHRLGSLTSDLQTTLNRLHTSPTLPPWSELQGYLNRITASLNAVYNVLSTEAELGKYAPLANFYARAHAHPLINFPGRTPEAEVGVQTLLRKKMEPIAEDWIAKGVKEETERTKKVENQTKQEEGDMFAELWDVAGMTVSDLARGILFSNGDGEEGDEEDDDYEDQMEDVTSTPAAPRAGIAGATGKAKPMMPLEDILRFMHTGTLGPVPGMARAPIRR